MDEHSNQMRMEGFLYETNEKLVSIWEGVYDEALHSDRYKGEATVYVTYDALHSSFKDWNEVKKGMTTLEAQYNIFFWIRVVLYVLGSIMIIAAKWPRTKEDR